MVVYDDLQPSEKIKIYDTGVSLTGDPERIHEMRIGYRTGDMWSPKLAMTEALRTESDHFLDCIGISDRPDTDGWLGAEVVQIIEAATSSMRGNGERIYLRHRKEAA